MPASTPFRTIAIWFALMGAVACTNSASAQTRASYFDQPSAFEFVGTPPASGAKVPLVVFLPATGGTSERMLEQARAQMPFPSYVAVLPAGAPSTSDYLPNFSGFVGWMESRVMEDLGRAKVAYPVDESRIYLVGFSLGGDTSWALLARHPETFAGAVVMGSRASARPNSAARRTMLARRVRVSFGMGLADDATRVTGATRTFTSVRDAGIPTQLVRYDGAHEAPDASSMRTMLAFVMTPPSTP